MRSEKRGRGQIAGKGGRRIDGEGVTEGTQVMTCVPVCVSIRVLTYMRSCVGAGCGAQIAAKE